MCCVHLRATHVRNRLLFVRDSCCYEFLRYTAHLARAARLLQCRFDVHILKFNARLVGTTLSTVRRVAILLPSLYIRSAAKVNTTSPYQPTTAFNTSHHRPPPLSSLPLAFVASNHSIPSAVVTMDRSRSIQANSGTAVSAIISPVPITHSTSFIRQNRLSLTTQQHTNRQLKQQQLVQQSIQPFKMERFKHVGSAIMADVDRRREEGRGKEKKYLKKNEGKSVVKRGANVVVGERMEEYQRTERRPAMDDEEADDTYMDQADEVEAEAEEYSRNSSAGTRHNGPGLRLQREQEEKTAVTTTSYSPSPSSSPLYSARSYASSSASASARNTPKSFIAANALSVIHTLPPPPPPPAATAAQLLHSSFGRTPAYLVARKEEAEERKKQQAEERKARAVPAGMRRVEEEERQATLARLREEGVVVERAIMALPLRCETVSRKRQKDELERKMADIEEAISLFSKKVVYITL